jgi:hypothetical protein
MYISSIYLPFVVLFYCKYILINHVAYNNGQNKYQAINLTDTVDK